MHLTSRVHECQEAHIASPKLLEVLRLAAVEGRAVPEHWQGDLLVRSGGSAIATLVECHSQFVMLAKVDEKMTVTNSSALIEHLS